MAGGEIRWSRSGTHPDRFLTVKSSICLFDVVSGRRTDNSLSQRISPDTTALLLSENAVLSSSFWKCIDWHPEIEYALAVGQLNGKVSVISPFVEHDDPHRILGWEYVPRHSRTCQSLAWNPNQIQLLAGGFDKYRQDYGVMVWDVLHRGVSTPPAPLHLESELGGQSGTGSLKRQPKHNLSVQDAQMRSQAPSISSGAASFGASSSARPIFELAPSDFASSVTWQRQSQKTLIVGLSNKSIKVFDLRSGDSSKAQITISTKAVNGITVDPFNDFQLLSFYESQMFLWDVRSGHHDKPVVTVSPDPSKHLLKVAWDPVRRNVISSLNKDSSIIRICHLRQYSSSAEEVELSYTDHHVIPKFVEYDWSKKNESSAAQIAGKPLPVALGRRTTTMESMKSASFNDISTLTSSGEGEEIVSYDCHSSQESRIIAFTKSGLIADIKVHERLCVSWTTEEALCLSFGRFIFQVQGFQSHTHADVDISALMYQRAESKYGLYGDGGTCLKQNVDAMGTTTKADHHYKVGWAWNYMDKMNTLKTESLQCSLPRTLLKEGNIFKLKYPSAEAILNATEEVSQFTRRPIRGLEHSSLTIPVYISVGRRVLTRLCGWGDMESERDGVIVAVKTMAGQGHYSRAAAVALFCLRLDQAVEVLMKATEGGGSDQHDQLQLVAMALAGLGANIQPATSHESSKTTDGYLWEQMCRSISPRLQDPYLKGIFLYLSELCGGIVSEDCRFESLMDCQDIPLYDRVAFAAMHFSSPVLQDWLKTLTEATLNRGDLHGLILTGLDCEGPSVDLLQSYVDRTSDIQTAALLQIHTGTYGTRSGLGRTSSSVGSIMDSYVEDVFEAPPGWRLVEAYFSLLNDWKLWHIRALTEALMKGLGSTESEPGAIKIPSQVFLCCSYCGRPISSRPGRQKMRPQRATACAFCRKPVPRCGICRRYMGTSVPRDEGDSESSSEKMHKFSCWFTWCQTCRHGGHSLHLNQWFRSNSECPITGCGCKCASMDQTLAFS